MKKYNRGNLNMILMGMVIPILVFVAIFNVTYSFFTATAESSSSSSKTGTLIVKLTDTNHSMASTVAEDSAYLFPGDDLVVSGKVENAGDNAFYAVLELTVKVTKVGATTPSVNETKYYTVSGSTTSEISTETYSPYAFEVEAPNANKTNTYTQTFNVSYNFDGNKYDDSYANAKIDYILKVFAMQSALFNTNNPEEFATIELIDNFAANDSDDSSSSTIPALSNTITYNEDGTIYAGYYPQTYVGETLNTTLTTNEASLLSSGKLALTGHSYNVSTSNATTSGDVYDYDGIYIEVFEYYYFETNERYVKLEQAYTYGSLIGWNSKFSDGTAVTETATYWFKVEPIQWLLVDDGEGGKIALCASVLGSGEFNNYDNLLAKVNAEEPVYPNYWATSELRERLNTNFLVDARLTGLTKTRSHYSTTFNYSTGETTNNIVDTDLTEESPIQDSIWLPSVQEMIDWSSSAAYNSVDLARCRKSTDFALATFTGTYIVEDTTSSEYQYNGNGIYWLRSANSNDFITYTAFTMMAVSTTTTSATGVVGVCPAFALNQ